MKESYKKSGLFLVMKKMIIELNLKEKSIWRFADVIVGNVSVP